MRSLFAFCVLACILVPNDVTADEPDNQHVMQGNVRASFQIKPLVQKLAGRRGQRIPFQFQVRTSNQAQMLRIRAVHLKQQLNGLVVVDSERSAPEAVSFSGPSEFELSPERGGKIQGFIDIPRTPTPFYVFGILVTDLGHELHNRQASNQLKGKIGVRFVTQYLLRLEVRVTNGRQENVKDLRIDSARLVDHQGLPYVESDIVNPTGVGVEFRLSCRLLDNNGKVVVPEFGLGLPVRASREIPDRFESLVLANNRVRLVAPVPQAVFPGQYKLDVKYVAHHRVGSQASFPVAVRKSDFPALSVTSVQVAKSLQVTPSQIELSLARRGNRRRPLTLKNTSSQPIRVKLSTHGEDGLPLDWATVQPDEVQLLPGRSRNVLIAAHAGKDLESYRYGRLRVQLEGDKSQDFPLALLGRIEEQPDFEVGALRWDSSGERPAFVVSVSNKGPVHIALNGRLEITNDLGQRAEIHGGFDRWLLPGGTDEIRFLLNRGLPPSNYQVQVQIRTDEESAPVTIKQQVVVQAPAERQADARNR